MTVISADMMKDPTWWGWAKDAVNTYKDHRKEVLKLYADQPFFPRQKLQPSARSRPRSCGGTTRTITWPSSVSSAPPSVPKLI